jgi:gluconate 2-dehydrogenase alpha chain
VRLMMLSTSSAHPDGIGNARGQLGRNMTHQIWQSPTVGLFRGERFNTFMGNTSTSHAIYDLAGDVFDHSGLGFVGGAQLFADAGERLPIGTVEGIPTAQGDTGTDDAADVREWGQGFKDRMRDWDSYIPITMQGESPAYEFNRFDLDPHYTDFLGRPLLRMTFDWTDNERRLYAYVAARASQIMERMGPTAQADSPEIEPYNVEDYQSTHIQGGAIFGTSPDNSVTNRYGQVWDAPNIFVTGAALFPQNPGANPTASLIAVMYHSLAAMKEQRYFSSPGELLS